MDFFQDEAREPGGADAFLDPAIFEPAQDGGNAVEGAGADDDGGDGLRHVSLQVRGVINT